MSNWELHSDSDTLTVLEPGGRAKVYSNDQRRWLISGLAKTLIWGLEGDGKILHVINPDTDDRHQLALPVACRQGIPRAHGRRILLTDDTTRLLDIDLESVKIVADCALPGQLSVECLSECSDGSVHLAASRRLPGVDCILRFNSSLALVDEQSVEFPQFLPLQPFLSLKGFYGFSPDGRYVLRPDMAVLKSRRRPGLIGRLGLAERQYACTVQLWQVYPLKMLRRLILTWMDFELLPGVTYPTTTADDFAALAAVFSDQPSKSSPVHETLASWEKTNREKWSNALRKWCELASSCRMVSWSEDSQSIWFCIDGFLVQTSLDGRATPLMGLSRYTLQSQRMPIDLWSGEKQFTAYMKAKRAVVNLRKGRLTAKTRPRQISAVNDRRIRLFYHDGEAILAATEPRDNQDEVIVVAEESWLSYEEKLERKRNANLEHDHEARQLVVPLASLEEASMRDALRLLISYVPETIQRHIIVSRIDISFGMGERRLSEAEFFAEIRSHYPGLVTEIGELLERHVVSPGPLQTWACDGVWSDDEDTVLFGNAALAYTALAQDPIPLLKGFCSLIDDEHSNFCPKKLIPEIYRCKGVSWEVVDFIIWYMGQTYNHHYVVQEMLERNDAGPFVREQFTGRDFAHYVANKLKSLHPHRILEEPRMYMHNQLTGLLSVLGEKQRKDPWTEAMASEIKNVILVVNAQA